MRFILGAMFFVQSLVAQVSGCLGITNATDYTLVLSGYADGGAYCTSYCGAPMGSNCYPTLLYDGSQTIQIPATAGLYLEYSVCANVSYNDQGQASCDGLLGKVGLKFGSTVEISYVDGGTASLGTAPTYGVYYPLYFTPDLIRFGLQNVTEDYYVFELQTGSADASCDGGACYTTLSPGAQQFVTFAPTGWIDLHYEVCNSVTYSDEGVASCAMCTDLGSFDITFTNQGGAITSGYNGVATILSTSNNISNVSYISSLPPCPLGSTIPTPQTYSSIPYRGVNLAGCDFAYGFQPPCACDAVYFTQQGCNTFRLPFLWEYLQGDTALGTGIDFTQGDALVYSELVTNLTSAGLTVIIDMHNYMRYNPSAPGTDNDSVGYIIGNTAGGVIPGPTADQYATAWASIATEFATNPNVIFDLMNEPDNMSTELILSNYNTAIAAIRDAETAVSDGIHHLLLLEGNNYSCLGTWTAGDMYGTANSVVFVPGNIVDSANHYAINVHEYFNGQGGTAYPCACGSGETGCVTASDILTAENFTAFVDYLQTYNFSAMLTELNGVANANCVQCIHNFLQAVTANPNTGSGGFIGWAGWSGGSFPTDYVLNLTPTYMQMGDTYVPMPTYQFSQGFQPFLTPL